jgi:hypothetical protein
MEIVFLESRNLAIVLFRVILVAGLTPDALKISEETKEPTFYSHVVLLVESPIVYVLFVMENSLTGTH